MTMHKKGGYQPSQPGPRNPTQPQTSRGPQVGHQPPMRPAVVPDTAPDKLPSGGGAAPPPKKADP